MPQMNPDAIMDMISQSQGASPEQEMGMDSMQGMPPEGIDNDMGSMPPMGMDPSMMPPSQSTGGYDDNEAMNMLAQLNLPQSAIDQLLSSMYPASGQLGMSMGTSPAAEGQSGNMALLAQLIGPLLAKQSQQSMDPSTMGMDPSTMVPPIPPQPPMPPQGMPPMGGPPMPPMPPQGMPQMPPMS
jgi:hypothetical protein